jgi:molybdopterin converting factor small subunit
MNITGLHVNVLAFGRIREIIGSGESRIEIVSGATAGDVWSSFVLRFPELAPWAATTRLARNGTIVDPGQAVGDGDELAFLPPVGGG